MSAPDPKRGGTWLYCPWEHRFPGGVSKCLARFRKAGKYRRHWRAEHA
jgi:hypothetical protein